MSDDARSTPQQTGLFAEVDDQSPEDSLRSTGTSQAGTGDSTRSSEPDGPKMTPVQTADEAGRRSHRDTDGLAASRIRRSMLWAAYGDALGFISELVDEKGLKRRTKGEPLDRLLPWTRRVGGRQGINVELPAGCWSDDTQLRMAVSRSIGIHGFDVEPFARIELPVWLSYALGGGRASKAAAKNLGKPRTLWYANLFPGWVDAGGNGAAMRIQPHVWASKDLKDDYMLDVIVDSVCTHGHPRAIIGACYHAATLAHCMRHGNAPHSTECLDIADGIGASYRHIESHENLASTWMGLWEAEAGRSFRDEWHLTVNELQSAILDAEACINNAQDTDDAYKAIIRRLGLSDPQRRGSGILTTVSATALAAIAQSAREATAIAANAVGSDTDTIATMVGALLGALADSGEPPEQPLDSTYLVDEAERLAALGRGENVESHTYPDLLTWAAPLTQADALVSHGGTLVVEGLGPVRELKVRDIQSTRNGFLWQWVETTFGQTLLIKRRPQPRALQTTNVFVPPPTPATGPVRNRSTSKRRPARESSAKRTNREFVVDNAIEYAKRNIDDNNALGYTVRRVAREGGYAELIALVAALCEDLRR